ncbi:MAG: hypothetical protein AAF249_01800 [Pseudomonadota bacterium]
MSDDLPDEKGPQDQENWFDRASALVKDMGEQGMDHPSSNSVLTGAAIGFAAGMFVFDSLGFLWGAFIGAAIAIAYELENKDT